MFAATLDARIESLRAAALTLLERALAAAAAALDRPAPANPDSPPDLATLREARLAATAILRALPAPRPTAHRAAPPVPPIPPARPPITRPDSTPTPQTPRHAAPQPSPSPPTTRRAPALADPSFIPAPLCALLDALDHHAPLAPLPPRPRSPTILLARAGAPP